MTMAIIESFLVSFAIDLMLTFYRFFLSLQCPGFFACFPFYEKYIDQTFNFELCCSLSAANSLECFVSIPA